MLNRTLEAHPLLSQYSDFNSAHHHYKNFSFEKNLVPATEENLYVIGLSELKETFIAQAKEGKSENITRFLEFDFTALSSLAPEHPFFIPSSPIEDVDFIYDTIIAAYYTYNAAAFLKLKEFVYPILIERLLNDENIFTNKMLTNTIYTAAHCYPQLTYERLKKEEKLAQQITSKIHSQHLYYTLLMAMSQLASTEQFFIFSAGLLLDLASQEIKIGIYHGEYKALLCFSSLFRNQGASTGLSLLKRKLILEDFILKANNNYYHLYVLMKTFGLAANYDENGEESTEIDDFYDGYISFSIQQLVNYAGRNDENGLDISAEEELHTLLALTIDAFDIAGASWVPFMIYKLYVASGREWNQEPTHHLSKLAGLIDDLKQDSTQPSTEDIHALELRLEQLASIVYGPREFISADFELLLSSKNERKVCIIDTNIDNRTQLNLHARQSLAERLIFSKTTNLHEIKREYPKVTYIIVNFGLVISDRPHGPNSQHRRIFKTMPIKISNFAVTGKFIQSGRHAEEALYDFLLREQNITSIVDTFKNLFGINMRDHKVYAVILDLHGTYDMCLSCSEKGMEFQNNFREKLLTVLRNQNLKTLTKYPGLLPVVMRYSSDCAYHYAGNIDKKKQGILALQEAQGVNIDLGSLPTEKEKQSFYLYSKRNIKFFGSNLLVHSKKNMHNFWNQEKCTKCTNQSINLESWTAFTTDNNRIRYSTESDKQFNYTLLGEVDTTSPSRVNI